MSNSKFGLTDKGFCKKRLDDLVTQLESEFKTVFGANFKVDPETKQGQIIANLATEFASLWNIAEDSFNAFNPSAASGKSLSDLVQLNGIRREKATYSTVLLTVTGISGTVIPSGVKVRGENNVLFEIKEEVIIQGVTEVSAQAEITGPVQAAANTLTEIFTPISGWDSVNNTKPAYVGSDEETDEMLRIRRQQSITQLSGSTLASLSSQLNTLDNVRSVLVLENDTDANPDSQGVAAHSVEAIILGGKLADIKKVLYNNKIPGIPYQGNITIPTLDSQGFNVNIKYTSPSIINISVEITLHVDQEYPIDGDARIKQNIVDYAEGRFVSTRKFTVGDDILLSELYTPINQVEGHYVKSLKIGKVGETLQTTNYLIDLRSVGIFDIRNITIIKER